MQQNNLPKELRRLLAGRTAVRDEIGCSGDGVFRMEGPVGPVWLKVGQSGGELRLEHTALAWLRGRLPVPEVLYFGSEDGKDYLLTQNVPGVMACDESLLADPEQAVRLLAEGLRLLQAVDISACPLTNRLDEKLADARRNIDLGLVDTSDWEPDNRHRSPEYVLEHLQLNRPASEELAFTHGDYCLPNIFIGDGAVCGFIDLGRAGIADRWQDIALCCRSLHHNFGTDRYDGLLFEHLGIEPDWEKIDYYILLDELF